MQSLPYMDNPDGHCGLVFFSQEQRPWELFTGIKPAGQVDFVKHLHACLFKLAPELQEGSGQNWMKKCLHTNTLCNLHPASTHSYCVIMCICVQWLTKDVSANWAMGACICCSSTTRVHTARKVTFMMFFSRYPSWRDEVWSVFLEVTVLWCCGRCLDSGPYIPLLSLR